MSKNETKAPRKSRSVALTVRHADPAGSGKPLKAAVVAEVNGQPGWLVKVKAVQDLLAMANEAGSISLSLEDAPEGKVGVITVGHWHPKA